MSNVKTINLTGEETEIDFGQGFMCFWVQNMGNSDVYAYLEAGSEPEADGVIAIGAGTSAMVSAANLSQINTLYLQGNGKVQIVGCYSVHSPFKSSASGTGKSDGISYISSYILYSPVLVGSILISSVNYIYEEE